MAHLKLRGQFRYELPRKFNETEKFHSNAVNCIISELLL